MSPWSPYSSVPVDTAGMNANYVMEFDMRNVPVPNGAANYFELGSGISQNFTGKTNLMFDMFIKPGSSTNLQILPVLKVDSTYTWTPANGSILYLSDRTDRRDNGSRTPFLLPISAARQRDADVRQVLFQWSASGAPYDSGTIYFDNFRADNDTFYQFQYYRVLPGRQPPTPRKSPRSNIPT